MNEFDESLQQAVKKYPGNPQKQLKEMGLAYINFFVKNPEYLRLLFLSNIKTKINLDFCLQENHLTPGHPFQTFFQAVENYKNSSDGDTMDQKELMLYCWGLVHGISVLIAHRDIPIEGDYLNLVVRIIEKDLDIFTFQIFIIAHLPVDQPIRSDLYNSVSYGLDKLVVMGDKQNGPFIIDQAIV
ncbi:MAG: hypothetical protein AWM53_01572 [Candidatus Dichloromethanomonas elyunquensis]|nr:MAG: hypothetical protein AWM53_01572 [Candidatus Dichloromethanomonas elyunquensis]